MRIIVTGATGFTGGHVVPMLLAEGHEVRCLVRPTKGHRRLPDFPVEWVDGDLGDEALFGRACRGMDVLVNVASIGFGHAPKIIEGARRAKIRRAVFISSTAIFTQLNAASKSVRMVAEEMIRQSGLDYTILRPTMIYGSSRDRNMCRLIHYLKQWPVLPVIGSGESLQQPVYVADVAKAVVDCIQKEQTIGKAYNISGKEPLTFNAVIDIICNALNRRVKKIFIPVKPVVASLAALERQGVFLPIKSEQILRLNEDKVFGHEKANLDFGYSPMSFSDGISLQLKEMMP